MKIFKRALHKWTNMLTKSKNKTENVFKYARKHCAKTNTAGETLAQLRAAISFPGLFFFFLKP